MPSPADATNAMARGPREAAGASARGPLREGERIASEYSPQEERPLGSYVVLAGAFGSAFAIALLALRRSGRELPERVAPADILLVGVAAHKLSRLVAKDKVTSFLRAPFTRFEESSGHGEVSERPRGHHLRLALGELLVCPYCLGMWAATTLTLGLVAVPRLTRLIGSILVSHTISDFLQVAYRAVR